MTGGAERKEERGLPSTDDLTGKVVVAMSGGVDSSVAALLLAREGKEVVGVSMQVWDYRNSTASGEGPTCNSKATCCAPSDFADARSVADLIGIPYYVFDFEKKFEEKVISRFLRTYASGQTPNPCVDCNNDVKFRELRQRSLSLGCASVATGHYVRVEEQGDGFHLFRGEDREKDQSYFLYGLRQNELAQTLFPLGGLVKSEVRELAREAGITTADKPESQDICFVSGPLRDFVGSRLGKLKRPGKFALRDGTVVGAHGGIHEFTVGQRKGLGLSGFDEPLYVLEIDAESGTVYVGYRHELEVAGFTVAELNWVHPDLWKRDFSEESTPLEVTVQVRHQHRGVPAQVHVVDGIATVTYSEEWTSAAPGQAAVFYDRDNREVLGGGRILPRQTSSRLQILPSVPLEVR